MQSAMNYLIDGDCPVSEDSQRTFAFVNYKHENSLAVARARISELGICEDGVEKPTPFQQVEKIAKSIGLKANREAGPSCESK